MTPIKMKTIDATPTWMGIFPMMKEFIYNGNEGQKDYVVQELERLCKAVDEINAQNKLEKKADVARKYNVCFNVQEFHTDKKKRIAVVVTADCIEIAKRKAVELVNEKYKTYFSKTLTTATIAGKNSKSIANN